MLIFNYLIPYYIQLKFVHRVQQTDQFALIFDYRLVHMGCAVLRSVHELFWALIFLQFFGLHPLTGVLAIAIPFSAICAKVYAEILEEADPSPYNVLPSGSSSFMV